jgi:hypothetical protein
MLRELELEGRLHSICQEINFHILFGRNQPIGDVCLNNSHLATFPEGHLHTTTSISKQHYYLSQYHLTLLETSERSPARCTSESCTIPP